MTRTLVLDLDGTLVDSLPDLSASLNRVLAARGLAPLAEATVRPMVGDGAPLLVARAFAARGAAPDADALPDFLADYTAHATAATRPFPGIPEALHALVASGWRLAVCTNKPERPARALLAALGLAPLLAAIGGGDSFATRKPDPGHLLATLAAAGGQPGAAVMVGDHRNDVAAAQGAGLPCIFAGWGYGPPGMAEGAALVARRADELPRLAARLLPEAAAGA